MYDAWKIWQLLQLLQQVQLYNETPIIWDIQEDVAGDYIKKGTFFSLAFAIFVLAQAAIQHLKDIAETFGSQWTVEHLLLRLRGLWDSPYDRRSNFLP